MPPSTFLDALFYHLPWIAPVVAHLIRTETTRAKIETRLAAVEKDRDDDRRELADALKEIRADVKTLLLRDAR